MYNRIKKLCDKNNMTGNELGRLLGLKKSPLTDWKNGKSKPTVEQIVKMCEIFAIQSDYIILGNESKALTDEEKIIISNYRNSSKDVKIVIKKILEIPEESQTGKIIRFQDKLKKN